MTQPSSYVTPRGRCHLALLVSRRNLVFVLVPLLKVRISTCHTLSTVRAPTCGPRERLGNLVLQYSAFLGLRLLSCSLRNTQAAANGACLEPYWLQEPTQSGVRCSTYYSVCCLSMAHRLKIEVSCFWPAVREAHTGKLTAKQPGVKAPLDKAVVRLPSIGAGASDNVVCDTRTLLPSSKARA